MQQRRGSHSVYALAEAASAQVHIVFITKYRRKLLRGEVQERCRDLIRQTRGKRVVAEATIPRAVLEAGARVDLDRVLAARQTSNVGARLAGTMNNGSHAVNAITALFIATGQDVATVAEASVAINDARITPAGDYYYSVTLPSLIVATHGGGTGLATARECLAMLGCVGAGTVRRLAEIVAATVLCGEISLGTAIVADEWVSSHDRLGRNR